MHRSLKFLAITACLLSLGGCGSLEEMNAKAEAQQRADDQARCEGYGYQPGTDRFADCMMATAQHRDMQQAIDRKQAAEEKQRRDDQWERDKARVEAADAQHRAEIEKLMSSDSGSLTPENPSVPKGKNCTTTTTSSQTDNAGTSVTTTKCD